MRRMLRYVHKPSFQTKMFTVNVSANHCYIHICLCYMHCIDILAKIAISKHYKGSTQHETLLVVSPGSLHMNISIENIVFVQRVY